MKSPFFAWLFIKTLLNLPTWLIVWFVWPWLPVTHKWRQQRERPFTPVDWAAGATPFTETVSALLWFHLIGLWMLFRCFQ